MSSDYHYPPEFVARVKKAFPAFYALHEALDRGDEMAGYMLSDGGCRKPYVEKSAKVVSSASFQTLRAHADEVTMRTSLFSEWNKIVEAQKIGPPMS